MPTPVRPLRLPANVESTAAIVGAPLVPFARLARFAMDADLLPTGTQAADHSGFRRRLVTALRDLARIEGRVAYEADAMDRSSGGAGTRVGPTAGP